MLIKDVNNLVMDNSKSEISDKKKGHLLRDVSFLTALITLLGYMLAYFYQKGFRDFFKLGGIFINDITLTQVLIAIAAILGIAGAIFQAYPLLEPLFKFNRDKKEWFLTRYILQYWVVLPVFVLFLLAAHLKISIRDLITIYIIYVVLVIVPLLVSSLFHEGKNYVEKLKNNIIYNRLLNIEIIRFNLFHSTKGLLIGIFGAFLILTLIAEFIGYKSASKQEVYHLLEHNKNTYIVVDEYKGKLIIAPFDKSSATITPNYQLIDGSSTLQKPLVLNTTNFKNGVKIKDN